MHVLGVKDYFHSDLKALSRSRVLYGSSLQKTLGLSGLTGLCFPSVHLGAGVKFPLGPQRSDNDNNGNAFSTQNDLGGTGNQIRPMKEGRKD